MQQFWWITCMECMAVQSSPEPVCRHETTTSCQSSDSIPSGSETTQNITSASTQRRWPHITQQARFNPLTPTVAIWVQLAIKDPAPDRVQPSFVIFDIQALWRSALSVRVPGCQKLQMTDLTRSGTGCFIASCTHMATVGVKGLY